LRSTGTVLSARPYVGDVAPPALLEDMSRYGNDGVHTDITQVQLPSGLWVDEFNGTSSTITIANSDSLQYFGSSITQEVWAYPNDLGEGAPVYRYLFKKVDQFHSVYDVGADQLESRFYYSAGSVDTTVEVITQSAFENNWWHIVDTWDNVNHILYMNGVQVDTKVRTAIMDNNTNNLFIGSQGDGTRLWKGYLTFPRIYNYALSPIEIQERFASTRWYFGV